MSDNTESGSGISLTDLCEAAVHDLLLRFSIERPSEGTMHLYPQAGHPRTHEDMDGLAETIGDSLRERFEEDISVVHLPEGPIEVIVESEAV